MAARRFGQDPRGQAGHRVDGRRARQSGPARARTQVGQLQRREGYRARGRAHVHGRWVGTSVSLTLCLVAALVMGAGEAERPDFVV